VVVPTTAGALCIVNAIQSGCAAQWFRDNGILSHCIDTVVVYV
jgi:hypothetical protein